MRSEPVSFVVARWALLVTVFVSVGAIYLRAQSSEILSVDLVHLLPKSDRSPEIEQVVGEYRSRFERRLLVLVGAQDAEVAVAAAELVSQKLMEVPQLSIMPLANSPVQHDLYSFYARHSHGLVDARMAQVLRSGDAEAVSRLVAQRYADPSALLNSDLIRSDPLLLLPAYLGDTFSTGAKNFQVHKGRAFFEQSGQAYVPIGFDISGSPFSMAVQKAVTAALEDAQSALDSQFPGTMMRSAGLVRHAAQGTETAEAEISSVGLGSLLGVVTIILIVFRSSLPLAATLVSIGIGAVAGFTVCLFIFGKVHLLTLVFGGSLVGISVDYAFHFFCERARRDEVVTGGQARSRVFAGISFGLVTTLIGFVGMLVAPFPGLRQMAVFSGVGLVASYLTVCLWFPLWSQRMRPLAQGTSDAVQRYLGFWQSLPRSVIVLVGVVVGVMSLTGIGMLSPQDDVRLFQSPNGKLLAEQQAIESVLGERTASQFFLVEGNSSEELLHRIDVLRAGLTAVGQLPGGVLSDFVPPASLREQNRELLVAYLESKDTFATLERLVGLPPSILVGYLASLKEPPRVLSLKAWLDHPASGSQRHLYLGERGGKHRAAVTLVQIEDLPTLDRLAAEHDGVRFIDTAGTYTRLFALYREQVSFLALLSYVLVTALLAWRYGAEGAVAIMVAPAFAAVTSLGVLGICGGTFSLFNVMALILVLGISVDYGIFFRESGPDSAMTLLAVVLSALTTILAFGLLAFSSTAAIHAFGVTIFVGIVVSLLVSPIAGVSLRGRE